MDEVYQFIHTRSGYDTPVTEDITQDIFLDVFKGLNKFRGLCSERTWVYRIARNKLSDFYRKQYSQEYEICDLDEALQIPDTSQDIDIQMEQSFEARFVRECLGKLPIQYRIILLMKYVDSKSISQIAEIINKSYKATESLLQRAKKTFIKEYQSIKQ
jgi:RNA polymerase sigma-70 factor (ECF subfamily)